MLRNSMLVNFALSLLVSVPFIPNHDTINLLPINLFSCEIFQTGVFLSIPYLLLPLSQLSWNVIQAFYSECIFIKNSKVLELELLCSTFSRVIVYLLMVMFSLPVSLLVLLGFFSFYALRKCPHLQFVYVCMCLSVCIFL